MLRSRYRRIVLFSARVVVSLIAWELILPRLGLRKRVRRTRPDRMRQVAAGFRVLAVEMGGVLIKVGQFLSARVDMLPEEVTSELAELQDEVPPEPFADIRRVVEADLGAPLAERFAGFEEAPLAAASLGQVHRARLRVADRVVTPAGESESENGIEPLTPAVVVKVQRPNIEAVIATDLAALRTVGNWLHRYPPIRRRADVPLLLSEFTRILYEEIDYLAEGRNAETFAANFRGRAEVLVPRVLWTHTTRRVLTLDDVYGIKITDYDAITAAGVDRAQVAQRLFEVYLRQIFEHGFFHADPHPGNLFVSPVKREGQGEGEERATLGWQLTFVDFGMAGRVPPDLRAGLREAVIAIGTRDATRLVKSYQMLGVLLPHADLALLERAEAQAFERFWGKSMAELREISLQEMHEFAQEFRGLIYTMPFQIPQDLILLGRTLAILAGMCTGLDPEFNVWGSLVPYARKLVAEEAVSGWEFWLGELGEIARALLALPRRTEAMLGKMEQGELAVQIPQLTELIGRLERHVRRMVGGILFAALLVSGVLLYLAGQVVLAGILVFVASVTLAWIMFAR